MVCPLLAFRTVLWGYVADLLPVETRLAEQSSALLWRMVVGLVAGLHDFITKTSPFLWSLALRPEDLCNMYALSSSSSTILCPLAVILLAEASGLVTPAIGMS